jgi:hypothetical protein
MARALQADVVVGPPHSLGDDGNPDDDRDARLTRESADEGVGEGRIMPQHGQALQGSEPGVVGCGGGPDSNHRKGGKTAGLPALSLPLPPFVWEEPWASRVAHAGQPRQFQFQWQRLGPRQL